SGREDLLNVLNPKPDFQQNANPTPSQATQKGNPRVADSQKYLAPEEDPPRAKSSRRILSEKEKFTFDEWTRAATDTNVNEAAAAFTQMAAARSRAQDEDKALFDNVRPAMKELAEWDRVARIDSVPATLFLLMEGRLSPGSR